jgi:hypothetical protein
VLSPRNSPAAVSTLGWRFFSSALSASVKHLSGLTAWPAYPRPHSEPEKALRIRLVPPRHLREIEDPYDQKPCASNFLPSSTLSQSVAATVPPSGLLVAVRSLRPPHLRAAPHIDTMAETQHPAPNGAPRRGSEWELRDYTFPTNLLTTKLSEKDRGRQPLGTLQAHSILRLATDNRKFSAPAAASAL